MTQDLVTTLLLESFLTRLEGIQRHIVHAAATDAADMIVIFGAIVEPHLRPAQLYLFDHALGRKNLKITVNGAQADVRNFPSNDPIDLIRSGMTAMMSDHFKDRLTLS